VRISIHDLRAYSRDKHRKVDDRPYGGGPGMVMRIEPIAEAIDALTRPCARHASCRSILLSPQGRTLSTGLARELAAIEHLILICGHYEGIDERVSAIIDNTISIGDYVLTGGELPAMVLIDCVARFVSGVLGHEQATDEESFAAGQLEYPHYTRPPVFRGLAVPDVLFSGDHQRIARWRQEQAASRTRTSRPDLLKHGEGCRAKGEGNSLPSR
jgi:tRNA (guanine37-N1)-methyltransferase